jgi:hypothetical protein
MDLEIKVDEHGQRWLVDVQVPCEPNDHLQFYGHYECLVRLEGDEDPFSGEGRWEHFAPRPFFYLQRVTGVATVNQKRRAFLMRFDYERIGDLIDVAAGLARESWSIVSDYSEIHFCFESERDCMEFSLSCPETIRHAESIIMLND